MDSKNQVEKNYGFVDIRPGQDTKPIPLFDELDCLLEYDCQGAYIIDGFLDGRLNHIYDWFYQNNLELIIGFQVNVDKPDLKKIEYAKRFTNEIGIAYTSNNEWRGRNLFDQVEFAEKYLAVAEEYDFQWVCPLTHRGLVYDLAMGSPLNRVLQDTPCFCLCAYILFGYLYADHRLPHQSITTLGGRYLYDEYGLTIEKLKDYVASLNIYSGVGFQNGLNAGSRVYARELGFDGIVVGIPFDLAETDNIPIKPKPHRYPLACGDFKDEAYIFNAEKFVEVN